MDYVVFTINGSLEVPIPPVISTSLDKLITGRVLLLLDIEP